MEQEVNPKVEELKELGKFGLIKLLGEKFNHHNASSLTDINENAAVIAHGNTDSVISSKLFIENIHFDLTYFPLKHLGYKTITVAVADIIAMNALPKQVIINIAISNRFSLEAVNELTDGMRRCCDRYGIDLAGLDLCSSQTGLTITVTAVGETDDEHLVQRVGAKENELLCVSGDLGAAYTGLVLLEREKKVFEVNPNEQPNLEEFSYLLERQLKPEPRVDIIQNLQKAGITPTSMTNVCDGLASALIHLCKASKVGSVVFENKLPVDMLTFRTLKDMNIVSTTIALNGGEDYELLFTVAQKDYEALKGVENVSVIGYIKEEAAGNQLITNDDRQIELKAQGFGEVKE